MKKSKLSQTTVRRRTRSSGEELPERPPAKQQRYLDSGSEDGPGGGDSSGGQFSDGPTARYGSQTRVLVHLRARSTTFLAG
ncbi:BnaC04g24350D [Brassica napus]|uniref:BnaC04g24350D protein n=1 Tax=Brassica napus TaxID=3708 RepID=A0A078H0Q2_BRANA|nr:BnaC04g24350D [Brassica napus]